MIQGIKGERANQRLALQIGGVTSCYFFFAAGETGVRPGAAGVLPAGLGAEVVGDAPVAGFA
jgi:hypothetical protein